MHFLIPETKTPTPNVRKPWAILGLSMLAALSACSDSDSDSDVLTDSETVTESSTSTDGIVCDYVNSSYNDSPSVLADSIAEWTCSDTERLLTANGIPDHAVGTFPNENNPNTISEQSVSASYTLLPIATDMATELGGPNGATGYILNGVKVDAGTGGSCDDSGTNCSLGDNSGGWSIEALTTSSFNFGADENNAHVQPDGTYHYHGIPEGFVTKAGGNSSTMTMIGWAADGFPIYARYGYSDALDASSDLKIMTGSYQLYSTAPSNRPSTDLYPMGTFRQDWEYVEGTGDLDECNGRVGVTPDFPAGIYHYFATDSYPFLQRCVKGEVANTGGQPPAQMSFDTTTIP